MRASTGALLLGRFWSRVRMGDGCWEWQGSRTQFGYGKIKVQGVERTTHRFSWELANGPIPPGAYILHRCDNPPCVRPDHLFLGTQADNIHDMDDKDRRNAPSEHLGARGEAHWTRQKPEAAARGERVGGSKLTADDVREIRRLRTEGLTLKVIAARFGVTFTNVDMIVNHQTWKHVE